MAAYYNDSDPACVAVLRRLIAENVIAPGDVDDRSIGEVKVDDIKGYAQVHLFAGGGLWSVAARLAGWPDERPLWTGSCPCQPFSQAGKRAGTDDPRHLWPDFFRLIKSACAEGLHPPVVVGEQVSGAAGYDWLDRVCSDLEEEGYACGACDIPACAVDAPHQRSRLYWIAALRSRKGGQFGGSNVGRVLADSDFTIVQEQSSAGQFARPQSDTRIGAGYAADADGKIAMGHAVCAGLQRQPRHERDGGRWQDQIGPAAKANGRNGSFWSDAEWIVCHDGKARRAKSGLRLLVDGFPGRVDMWRIAGNAIVPVLAAEVLASFIEAEAIASLFEGECVMEAE